MRTKSPKFVWVHEREGYIYICRMFLHSASLLSLEIFIYKFIGMGDKASKPTEEIRR